MPAKLGGADEFLLRQIDGWLSLGALKPATCSRCCRNGTGPKVELRLSAWLDFDAPKGVGFLGAEFFDEATHGPIAAGESVIGLQVLKDSLGGETNREFLFNDSIEAGTLPGRTTSTNRAYQGLRAGRRAVPF